MTTQAFKNLKARREKVTNEMAAMPQEYKICQQCKSASFKHSSTCRVCGCYRWWESPAVIRHVCRLMKRTAMPVTMACAPRI